MRIIIGVDAGGSRTRAVAVSMGGDILARSYTGPANPLATSFDIASGNIAEAIKDLLKILGNADIEMLGVGLAGGTAESVRREVMRRISQLLSLDIGRIVVVGDEIAAHASTFPHGDGVIGILGTGSIVYGRYRGREFRCGGWGYLLGDEGSAYRIGLRALREYLSHLEGRGVEAALHELIKASIGFDRVDEVLASVYTSDNPRVYIASLAPIVFKAYESGDPLARAIVVDEMRSFVDQVVHTIKSLGMDRPLVSFTGSVYEGNREVLKKLLATLIRERISGEVEIIDPIITPACASAIIAARENMKSQDLERFIESIIKSCGRE